MAAVFFALWLAVIFCSQIQRTSSLSDMYVGAVVEYSPVVTGIESDRVKKNIDNYINFIKIARQKGADIIVFPEAGLTASDILSPVPEPFDYVVPCTDSKFEKTILKSLSCAAKEYHIYAVINLPEKRECKEGESCPSKGYFKYNTNVVFDRSGMVVARYAKFNLFDEPNTDQPPEPEMSFFDTDFDVRFGTFICFDILFLTPTLRLIQQYNITNFVFSTAWFSELPFLTALQAQTGWAQANDVNLLASGFNLPSKGSSGSGIYNGKFGALVAVMPEEKTSRLLLAGVPKRRSAQFIPSESHVLEGSNSKPEDFVEFNLTDNVSNTHKYFVLSEDVEESDGKDINFHLLSDQVELFSSKVLENGKTFSEEVCSRNQFCCQFRVNVEKLAEKDKGYNYRAVVFDGVRGFGKNFTGGVQMCGIVVCKGPLVENCTSRVEDLPGMFKFREIFIEGNFLSKTAFQMPTTLTDGNKLVPLPAYKYEYKVKEHEKTRTVSMELLLPVDNLATFGIWGRDYSRDREPRSSPFSNGPTVRSLPVLFIASVALVVFRQ